VLHCESEAGPEYLGSLLAAVAGVMVVCNAADFALLFVGLELVSIPTYVMLCLGRSDAASREAAAKYFFLSVLASAVLLFGLSFLYGAAGTIKLSAVAAALNGTNPQPAGFSSFARPAAALIFAGLCFKIAAVPFHFYAPDVYQGTSHANAAFLSVVPKAAGFAAVARLLWIAAPGLDAVAWGMVLAVSVLSMTLGNVLALWQDDLRRMMAYSSIAQTGTMLLALAAALAPGVAAGGWNGFGALWFYLAVYAAATIGVFAMLEFPKGSTAAPGRAGNQIAPGRAESHGTAEGGRPTYSNVDDLAGLGQYRPAVAAALALCLLSLTGIPPLAGFWGKLLAFGSALGVENGTGGSGAARPWFLAATIAGVLNAAVAAAYYLRVVGVMYFRGPASETIPTRSGGSARWAGPVCAMLVTAAGLWPGPLLRESNRGVPAEWPRVEKEAPPPQSAPRPGAADAHETNARVAATSFAAIIVGGCDNRLSHRFRTSAESFSPTVFPIA